MKRNYFQHLEEQHADMPLALEEVIKQLAFNDKGLIPIIVQDAETKAVLMFAWMSNESFRATLSTGQMTYWSRSRQQLWVKGETSGHVQSLVSMSFDCDGDAILCEVKQQGAACHTDRKSCFYLAVDVEKQLVRVNQ